jgi:hypothetical protein
MAMLRKQKHRKNGKFGGQTMIPSYTDIRQQISNMEEVLEYMENNDCYVRDYCKTLRQQIVLLYDIKKDLEDWQVLAVWELGGTFYSIIASKLLDKIQFMQGSLAADPYNDTLIWSGGFKEFIRPMTEKSEAVKALYGEL